MPNYKLLIEYDGRRFEGWQRQKLTSNTIQEKLEEAILTCSGIGEVKLVAAGRTDSGVSALNQVANFKTGVALDRKKLLRSVNALLPYEITLKSITLAEDSFNSRFSAIRREYIYRCTTRRKSVYREHFYHIGHKPDLSKINEFIAFAKALESFRSFCKNKEDKRNFECRIDCFKAVMNASKGELIFTISADRFLHSMIRALIGCALDISRGRFELAFVKERASKGEKFNLYFLPPEPLILNKITYGRK